MDIQCLLTLSIQCRDFPSLTHTFGQLATQVVFALKPYQIATMAATQILIIVLYASFLVHDKYPKEPDIYPYPNAGEPGGPEFQQPVPVIPFKRYPPGFDHYDKRPDGTGSTYSSERILQRQFKYQLEIITYVYLGFGMQYSFLRKVLVDSIKMSFDARWRRLLVGSRPQLSSRSCVPFPPR